MSKLSELDSLLKESTRIRMVTKLECGGDKDKMIGALSMKLAMEYRKEPYKQLFEKKKELDSLIENSTEFLSAHLRLRFGESVKVLDELPPELSDDAFQMLEALIRSVKREMKHEPANSPQSMEVGPTRKE